MVMIKICRVKFKIRKQLWTHFGNYKEVCKYKIWMSRDVPWDYIFQTGPDANTFVALKAKLFVHQYSYI